MGHILFLAHRLPFPPDRGDRIRSWHVLQALAKLAPVHVCALIECEADLDHVATVESVAASVSVARRGGWRGPAIARALVRNTPASVEAFRSAALRRTVRRVIMSHPIDCIYAFSGQMADYVPHGFTGRFLMDFVDVDSAKFEDLGGCANRHEARKLRRWESEVASRADASLFVTQAEAALFKARSGRAATVLENGIDLDHFFPRPDIPVDEGLIVFTGQMDYRPNVEAVARFVSQEMPKLPGFRFAVVGRNPDPRVLALQSEHVLVTGEVPDTRPWLARGAVVVAPLKIARGMQNKVLEAMAMGKLVVASTAAATGIDAVDGRDFTVSDTPAAAVTELLEDRAIRQSMGAAARARVEERYAWHSVMAPLRGIVEQ